ncbi:MAG: hypothetical protein M3457_01165 [Chloroflexota bacterium]|nr:hypothetical protein [Chloroflexota bacterium]
MTMLATDRAHVESRVELDRVTLALPAAPPRELSPNARVHWRTRATAAKATRDAATLVTRSLLARSTRPAFLDDPVLVVDIEIMWGSGRKRHDTDNATGMMKSGLDGIADGLGVNDRAFRLGTLTQGFATDRAGYVVVVIRPDGGDRAPAILAGDDQET